MSYAEITFRDRNPVKRWLQRRRLVSAVQLAGGALRTARVLCDFGAGNGELCKFLAARCRDATLICYEPTPRLLAEARENLSATPGIEFREGIETLPRGSVDIVFCLEVFEHLTREATEEVLRTIQALLKPGGMAIVGVPVEIGFPALYKGVFRMTRRYGEYDARFGNVLLACLGSPPRNRPLSEIAPGFGYHFQHLGFDYRRFREVIPRYLTPTKMTASPFAALGPQLMPEVYFVARKAGDAPDLTR